MITATSAAIDELKTLAFRERHPILAEVPSPGCRGGFLAISNE